MICKHLDQSLLLLAHGALSAPARLCVGAHLRLCPACQSRYERLVAASVGIADELRGASLPIWSPQPQPVWSSPVSLRPALTTRLAVLLCLLAVLSVTAAASAAYRMYADPVAADYFVAAPEMPVMCKENASPVSAPSPNTIKPASASHVASPTMPATVNVTPWKGPGAKAFCAPPVRKKVTQ